MWLHLDPSKDGIFVISPYRQNLWLRLRPSNECTLYLSQECIYLCLCSLVSIRLAHLEARLELDVPPPFFLRQVDWPIESVDLYTLVLPEVHAFDDFRYLARPTVGGFYKPIFYMCINGETYTFNDCGCGVPS